VRMQVGRAVAAVAVVGAVVSGCGGPDQAGAAVIVGDTAVSLESVQTQLTAALSRVPAGSQQRDTPATIARDIVSNEVVHGLVTQQATAAGIVVADAQVDAFIAQQGGTQALLQNSILDVPGLRQQVRDFLVSVELGRRAAAGLQVTVDLVGAASKDQAADIARRLAAGGALAAGVFQQGKTSKQGVVSTAATSPGDAGSVLYGAPVGDTVYYQPDPQQANWLVAKIVSRNTNAKSSPAAVSQITQSQLAGIGQRLLQPLAEVQGVRVNPRYGVWDPISLRVVAADQVSGSILPAATG